MSQEEEALLQVQDLCTWFPIRRGVLRRTVGHVRAVDGVSLTIRPGETLALVGESGCGKTTLGRSILRLIEPTSGSVDFLNTDLLALTQRELHPLRKNIQMIFQDPMASLDPRMRIVDAIAEGMRSFGIGKNESERRERVAELLRRVQLDPEHMDRYPHEFSGGQRQRICIARALAVDPKLVICDEAVSALDVSVQAQILNLLSELQTERQLAYLFITHDLGVVRYIADRVAVMYLGQVVEEADTEILFSQPKHPYTQGLLKAIPSLDPTERAVRAVVAGDVPSPSDPPPGCRFHTRCASVFDACRERQPELRFEGTSQVRCLLYEEVAEKNRPS